MQLLFIEDRLYSSPKKYSTAPSGNLFGSVLPNMKYKSNQIFTPFTDERESVRYDFGDRLYEPDLVLQACCYVFVFLCGEA